MAQELTDDERTVINRLRQLKKERAWAELSVRIENGVAKLVKWTQQETIQN